MEIVKESRQYRSGVVVKGIHEAADPLTEDGASAMKGIMMSLNCER